MWNGHVDHLQKTTDSPQEEEEVLRKTNDSPQGEEEVIVPDTDDSGSSSLLHEGPSSPLPTVNFPVPVNDKTLQNLQAVEPSVTDNIASPTPPPSCYPQCRPPE